jgi:hypothetical protein
VFGANYLRRIKQALDQAKDAGAAIEPEEKTG